MTAGFGLFQWGGYLSYRVGRQNFSILYLFKQMAGIVPLSMLKSIHHITQHACMYTNDYNQWENIIIIIICHQIHYLQTIEHIITNLSGYAIVDYYCPLLLAMLTVLCHKCTNMLEPWQCHTVSVHLAHKRIVHRVGNTESRGSYKELESEIYLLIKLPTANVSVMTNFLFMHANVSVITNF